jgi:hypothetical protein
LEAHRYVLLRSEFGLIRRVHAGLKARRRLSAAWASAPAAASLNSLPPPTFRQFVTATRAWRTRAVKPFGGPYVMPYENGPIILCQGLREPLSEAWPRFRSYR